MLSRMYETPEDGNYFSGYYDKSPLNASASSLLALRVPFINRMPVSGEKVDIGHFYFPGGGEFRRLSSSLAWNWQQGCMLQWVGPDYEDRILFNDIRQDRYRTVILDVLSGDEQVLQLPSYSISSDGRFAICVDYDRLYWFRPGYNYQGVPRIEKKMPLDVDDGIWFMSLDSGRVSKIITMADVMNLGVVGSMVGAMHWLEHVMISPGNTRFAFLHRWRSDAGTASRLITADADGGNLYVLNDSGRVSHFCWMDDATVFGYCGKANAFNRLRGNMAIARSLIKPLLPIYHRLFPAGGKVSRAVTGDCFQLMRDRSTHVESIERDIIQEDGHPTFQPGSTSLVINDSYPDEFGNCRLFLFNVTSKKVIAEKIVSSDPNVRATGYRCDLHPKWSFDGRFVTIDTISERGRGMAVYSVDPLPAPA